MDVRMMLAIFPNSAFPRRSPLYLSQSNNQYIVSELRLNRWTAATDDNIYPTHGWTISPVRGTEEAIDCASTGESSSQTTKKSLPSRNVFQSSKQPERDKHPAFRRVSRITKLPPKPKADSTNKSTVRVAEDGVSYVIDGAPFEFKYSYTETPKVKAIKLREPPFSPFGAEETPRPWTGRAPLPPSKKRLKEFDSFQLPPPNKKGVKPVQAPGPYLAGTAPRYVYTREEILGEPLTPEEIQDLINGCLKSRRQLNMGRDGFTHNMLDNIHAHWKRRRVCKIKCKGVCTVDMDTVCQQLEEKTGGKVIFRNGGLVFLFRGRNYNFRTRPRFPLMLWKPITPIYPKLVKKVPEGLTLEEATALRAKGNKLTPICKLGKNGVYSSLVKHCQEAFDVCELVKIDCAGLNPSDYRKIGAKLKDLVPCVIISFDREEILIWKRNEKSQMGLTTIVENSEHQNESDTKENNSELHIDGSQVKSDEFFGASESIAVKGIEMLEFCGEEENGASKIERSDEICLQEVMQLWKQAIESESAVLLEDEYLDADRVYERSVALAKTSPPFLIFRHDGKRVDTVKKEGRNSRKDSSYAAESGDKKGTEMREFDLLIEAPHPHKSLVIDELAKLLAS